MKKHIVQASLLTAGLAGLMFASPASAIVVDDFESYSTGNLPLGPTENWQGPSRTLTGGESITVQNNANNLSGNHLQVSSSYPTVAVTIPLPALLSNDGDYVQYAAMIVNDNPEAVDSNTYLGMHLAAAPVTNPNSQPPGAIGIAHDGANGGYNAFTVHHNGISNYFDYPDSGELPWMDRPPYPTEGFWYYLRATMRDSGGTPGAIDSYDFQVFDNQMNLLGSKLGVPFPGFAGEGSISYIGLAVNEQTGTDNAVVLFDDVTMGLIPEPSALGLLGAAAALGLARRRRA